MDKHTILVDCPDQKGLVHKITGVLFNRNLNIDDQGEFVQKDTNHFFMRTVVSGEINQTILVNEIKSHLPAEARVRLTPKVKKRIVVLVTKEPHCIGDLLIRHAYDNLNAEILAVIGNHSDLEPLISKFDLPFHHIPHSEISKKEHEQSILEVIERYNPEYIVLAKYMRILSGGFVERFSNRIINIHHSFLPAFAGANPYRRAFERGVKIIGATAHFVTQELDQGPIIAQNIIPVDHSKSIKGMIEAGRNVEKIVLADALRLVFEERVFVHGNRTIIFD